MLNTTLASKVEMYHDGKLIAQQMREIASVSMRQSAALDLAIESIEDIGFDSAGDSDWSRLNTILEEVIQQNKRIKVIRNVMENLQRSA